MWTAYLSLRHTLFMTFKMQSLQARAFAADLSF
jgi:hypothetical protein